MSDKTLCGVYAAIFCRRQTKPLQVAARLLEAVTGDRPRNTIELVAIATDFLGLPPEDVLDMTANELVAQLQRAAVAEPLKVEQTAEQDEGDEPRTTKKRSTERGEGRFKLIAALIEHHKYDNGSCLNPAPIGNNELAKAAEVSTSTASAFFNEQFKGHTKYKAICRDIGKLVHSLKLLSGEFSPHDLYGSEPPEKRRDGRRSRQESNDD